MSNHIPRVEFIREGRAALVEIRRPEIVQALFLDAIDEGFKEKEEFHVTVLPRLDGEQPSEQELDQLQAVLDGEEVDDIRLAPSRIALVEKPKIVDGVSYPRESIIVPVHSERIHQLLGRVSMIYGRDVPKPFLHVTLFTRGENRYARRGIGIDTLEEFAALHPQPFPIHH